MKNTLERDVRDAVERYRHVARYYRMMANSPSNGASVSPDLVLEGELDTIKVVISDLTRMLNKR